MVEKAAREATKVDEALRLFYSERPLDLGAAVGWHLLGNAVGIAPTWLFFRLLNQNASAAVAASAWLLGMWFDTLTFAIPMNAGTLEGSRIVAFKALGYNALLGLTYGATLRMAQLFWALFGLASYGLLALRTRTRLDFRPRSSIQKEWSRSR